MDYDRRTGPWTLPFLRSSNPSARARSTMDLGVNTIWPLSAWASRRSPTRTPTCSRTRCGITTWYFFWIVTMGIGEQFNCLTLACQLTRTQSIRMQRFSKEWQKEYKSNATRSEEHTSELQSRG